MFRIIYEPSTERRIRSLKKKVAKLEEWAAYYKREHTRLGMLAYGMDCMETPYEWGCTQQAANNKFARYHTTLAQIRKLEEEIRQIAKA